MFECTVDSGSFSIGFDWKYENGEDIDPEYLVMPKYKDLKEEMLNHKYLYLDAVNNIIIKAQEYLDTNVAKSIKKGRFGSPLKIPHLICIIMYCDYSELSSDFTLSFRKSYQFQILSQKRRHNSRYYHWSTILKETIKKYGQNHSNGNGALSQLKGPFFCGMSTILNIPQFSMYIYSPLSTSVHLEVALQFSGESGMILEMDNSQGRCKSLQGMDVSWISRYREENERYVDLMSTLWVID